MTELATRIRRLSRPDWVRLPPVAASLALCALSLVEARRVQDAEATISGALLRDVFSATTYVDPNHDLLYVWSRTLGWVGFHVALSCSTALLLPGLCLVTAVLFALRPVAMIAPLVALFSAAAVFGACNLGRITLIALVGWRWGTGAAFDAAHVWAGTAVTICGVTAAVGAYLYALGTGRRRVTRDGRGVPGESAVPAQERSTEPADR